MSRLILATSNAGKVEEIKQILHGVYDEIVTASEIGIDMSDIEEDAATFQGNAEKKAIAVSLRTDDDVLADDSGLEVHALNGAPGIRSARFAGDMADDATNNAKLVELMRGYRDRSAEFICCMVIARRGIVQHVVEGRIMGEVLDTPRGNNGFGYDPLFYLPTEDMTFAEIAQDKKNLISHRAQALQKLRDVVEQDNT